MEKEVLDHMDRRHVLSWAWNKDRERGQIRPLCEELSGSGNDQPSRSNVSSPFETLSLFPFPCLAESSRCPQQSLLSRPRHGLSASRDLARSLSHEVSS